MSLFLMPAASSNFFPLIHSLARLLLAIADPHPNVLRAVKSKCHACEKISLQRFLDLNYESVD